MGVTAPASNVIGSTHVVASFQPDPGSEYGDVGGVDDTRKLGMLALALPVAGAWGGAALGRHLLSGGPGIAAAVGLGAVGLAAGAGAAYLALSALYA